LKEHQLALLPPDLREYCGDGAKDASAAINLALLGGGEVQLPSGTFQCATEVKVPSGAALEGPATLRLLSGAALILDTASRIRNITVDCANGSGIGISLSDGSSDIRLDGVKISGARYNAIQMSNVNNITINNCVIDQTGFLGGDITSEMMGIYVSISKFIAIRNCKIRKTMGHGAIFLNSSDNINIEENDIESTFYSGVRVFGKCKDILISGNKIGRIGEINSTYSGVGCNGIYVAFGDESCVILRNIIDQVSENGIEGVGCVILENTVRNTGYRGLKTPSTEGIYAGSGSVVVGNRVDRAAGAGIKAFGNIENIEIRDNKIYSCKGPGIEVHASGAGCILGRAVVVGNVVVSEDVRRSTIDVSASNGAVVLGPVEVYRNAERGSSRRRIGGRPKALSPDFRPNR
jgi:hypothetical protein